MTGGAEHGLALALANNLETSDNSRTRHGGQSMKLRRPLLRCACDRRYCNQDFCMTEGVCFASVKRKRRKRLGEYNMSK